MAGQVVAVAIGVAGFLMVVVPVFTTPDARNEVFDPFPRREPAKTTERIAPGGTRTVETEWADDSALDKALAGGGLVLVRLGIVGAAALAAGAAVQRVLLAHFAFELGPLKLGDLPEAAEASREILVELAGSLDELRRDSIGASTVTERALVRLKNVQRAEKEAFERSSRELRDRLEGLEQTVNDMRREAEGRGRTRAQTRRQPPDQG